MTANYIGRFAPSPTGPLHLGSLYTALASYLDAKQHNGQWLLRIEDLDPPREQPGATASIIHSLEQHGLHWDGDILYQSQRHLRYQAVIEKLSQQHVCYRCSCSRQQLKAFPNGYPGFCRSKSLSPAMPAAIRLIADRPAEPFTDRLLGLQCASDQQEAGYNDFIIQRKDGLFAYQLAVVVDDIDQGVTDIVRGSDILDSTFKQGYLYRYLQQPPPRYLHLPVIENHQGQKLSKQNFATAVDNNTPCHNLLQCLQLLNQALPPPTLQTRCSDILTWATQHWDISRLHKRLAISSSMVTGIN